MKELSVWRRAAYVALAMILAIVAWEGARASFGEHFTNAPREVNQPSPYAVDTPLPGGTAPTEYYQLRSNWPMSGVADLLGSGEDGDICVIVVACSPSGEVLTNYVLFAENAAQKGYPLQRLYDADSLADWQDIAVSNACFINDWSAYIAGALLWYAYDDESDDINAYNTAITQSCPESEVFDRPQPKL